MGNLKGCDCMTKIRDKRVYAGYYQRYDGQIIYVVMVIKDADTGADMVLEGEKKCTNVEFQRRKSCRPRLYPKNVPLIYVISSTGTRLSMIA